MAYGIELILGFQQPKWHLLGLPIPRKNHDLENWLVDREWDELFEPINVKLKKAHLLALEDRGFIKTKGKPRSTVLPYPIFRTPLGLRKLSPFMLEAFYDPNEMGDEIEDAIIGVAISSRYFPRFADWKEESGTLSPMVFDKELNGMMLLAKNRICAVVPALETAPWIVKEINY